MVLLAIYKILLTKLSGLEDMVVGIPTAGRRHPDVEHIIGMFVNTLALRNFPIGEKSFRHFLHELSSKTLQAFEHQEYPFEDLVESVSPNRDSGRNPLFDVMFVLQNMELGEVENPCLKMTPRKIESTVSKFDMTLIAVESNDRLSFDLEYSTGLFKEETIRRYILYFRNILAEVTAKPDGKIADIEIVTPGEKLQIFEEFNHEPDEYPQKTIMEMFNEQIEANPDNNASFDKDNYLTYKALNDRANVLAKIIKEL
jgi:non-ribosomal peptide synthetase component F